MAANCHRCGARIAFLKRLNTDLCDECKAALEREAAERQAATAAHQKAIETAAMATLAGTAPLEELSALVGTEKVAAPTFRRIADAALADDLLNELEEERLSKIATVLGISQNALETNYRDVLLRLVVARVNDGRLPILQNAGILLKKGEVAHASMRATLMKEVTLREYRGGYAGVSFRIAKGVRFNTGAVRGRSVVVGSELRPDSGGVLFVTSRRIVFVGERATIQVPLEKLIDMDVFENAIRLHSATRKLPVLFTLESGSMIAAVANAAAQHLP